MVASLLIGKLILERRLKSLPSGKYELIGADNKLRPAEIAYLERNGDLSHAMLVLTSDLIQRALKSSAAQSLPPTTQYEQKMWSLTKTSITDWMQDKTTQYLPGSVDDLKKNPLAYARKVSTVYRFFTTTVRNFVVKVLQDPRHIRKYFSLTGIMRLIADFTSAGYQLALERELQADLLKRGLLVPEKKREAYASTMWLLSAAAALAIAALLWKFVGTPLTVGAIFAMALINAIFIRGIFFALDFLPLYSELAAVVSHLERQSWRLSVLKLALRSISILCYLVVALVFLLMTLIAGLVFHFGLHAHVLNSVVIYICTTLGLLFAVQTAVIAWKLRIEQRSSRAAEIQLHRIKQKLAKTSPLESFTDVLQSTEYDPTFSEILAIYGIETLLILV